MTNNIISIHQPSYLPWLGYFHKIYTSSCFVLHDNVQFSKNSMYRRCFIRKGSIDKELIIVPLKKHSDYELLKNLEICNDQQWQQKHLNKIKNVYEKTIYFEEYFPFIEDILNNSRENKNFTSFISYSLEVFNSLLCIDTLMLKSSLLPITGVKTEYNINIIDHLKGDVYLSGIGAFNSYQKAQDYIDNDILLLKQDIYSYLDKAKYPQGFDFINGLSIIDALFNIGRDGITKLFDDYNLELLRWQRL